VALLFLSLACVRIETSYRITQREGQEELVTVTVSQYVTDEYIEAARRANADREADYRAAGRDIPDDGFVDTLEEAAAMLMDGSEDLEADGFQVTSSRGGFTAEATFTLSEFMALIAEESTVWLTVDRDRSEGVVYIFETDLEDPELDLDEIDNLRREWPLPKPPLDQPVATPESESFFDFIGVVVDVLNLAGTDLDAWYVQRIFVEAGLPSFEYTVVLPGQIVVSEVSGVPHGQINGNQVTLEVGEDFWREFGAIDHLFHVESLVSICESDCAEPHMIWDGVSEYPVCTCICEKGWEMRFEGCLDCETICREQDPDSVYDAAASSVNNCVCQVPSDQDSGGGAPVVSADSGDLLPDPQAPGPSPGQAAAGAVAAAAGTAAVAAAAAAASSLTTGVGAGGQQPTTSAPPSTPTTPPPTTAPPASAPPQTPSTAPTQLTTAAPTQVKPPVQPSPLQPVGNLVRDRIKDTLDNIDPQTGQGQVDFGVTEITNLLPPEIPLTRTDGDKKVDLGTVKDVRVHADSGAGTFTVELEAENVFDGMVNGPVRLTVRPSVQNGQMQLEVQEARIRALGFNVDVMQLADVAEAEPILQLITGDIRGELNKNVTRALSAVNETLSNMGGQLQHVTVTPNGIRFSLSPTN
jgi:hypothetical protein